MAKVRITITISSELLKEIEKTRPKYMSRSTYIEQLLWRQVTGKKWINEVT